MDCMALYKWIRWLYFHGLGGSATVEYSLLNLIGGVDSPDSGVLLVDGKNICNLSERELTDYRRNKIGFVFQFFHLLPELTAEENVSLIADFSGKGADTADIVFVNESVI